MTLLRLGPVGELVQQAVEEGLDPVDDRGWPRTAIRTKPFWTPGKRGLD